MNEVLKGEAPRDALTIVERARAAQFFRDFAPTAVGKFKEFATQFNIERARFLEGVTDVAPGKLPDYISRVTGQ